MFKILCGKRSGGISQQSVGHLFAALVTAPWTDPGFRLWALVRHGATTNAHLQNLALGRPLKDEDHA
jgi:hypothetical protein